MKKIIMRTTILATSLSLMGLIPLNKMADIRIENKERNITINDDMDHTFKYDIKLTIKTRERKTCERNSGPFYYYPTIQKDLSIVLESIFYYDTDQLYKEFIRMVIGEYNLKIIDSNLLSDMRNIEYFSNNNELRLIMKSKVDSHCYFKPATYPNYHAEHYHHNYSTNFKWPADKLARDVDIQIKLNRSLFDVGFFIKDIINKNDVFIKIDEDNTIQGFKHNYFGIKLESDYLKSLILSSINLNAITNIITDNRYEAINNTDDFNTIIEYFRCGKLFDPHHPMTNKIISENELNDPYKNVRYWLDKIIFGEGINSIHNDEIWLSNYYYIEQYDINVSDDKICFLYNKLLLNKLLKLEIDWLSNNDSYTTDLNFTYDMNSKSFIFRENNLSNYKIRFNENNDGNNKISIIEIRLMDPLRNYKFPLCNINIMDNNKLVDLDIDKYTYNYSFKVNKLINVKKNLNTKYWIDLFEPYADNVEDWIDNPEKLNNNEKFKNLITRFSKNNSPIEIIDDELYSFLEKEKLFTFENNQLIKNLIHDYEINTYNSVNGIEFSINYYDYNSSGIKQSDELINETVRYSLSENEKSESTHTIIINNKIISKNNVFETPEQLILDKFIGYENTNDNKLLTTKLSKQDWIENALNFINITEKNRFGIKGVINYNKNSSKINFINNKKSIATNSFDFEISFYDAISDTDNGSNPDDDTLKGTDMSIAVWVGISSIVSIILIFIIAYYFICKNKKNKLQNGKNNISE